MDKKIKIAFYCSSLSWGGLEMNLYNRAVWMSQRGYPVILFCVKNSPIHKNAVDVNTVVVKRNKKGLDVSNAVRLGRLISKEKIGLVWFSDKRDLSLLAMVKFFKGSEIRLLYQQCMQLGVSKREWWHTVRFKRIDAWITPLNYLREQVKELTRFPVDRVHVIPQGLQMKEFIESIPSGEVSRNYFNLDQKDVVIGMIGRIDFAKAQAFVMDVVEDLQVKHNNLKMLMVGNKTEGEWEVYYNEIERRVRDDHASGDIKLFPFMKEVGLFYGAIDIFVMASKNETYGMVTIESMICGNKIVGTGTAGTKELLGDGERGYQFNWMDAASLKNALEEVLNKPDEAKLKAYKGQEFARKTFSKENELDAITSVIDLMN